MSMYLICGLDHYLSIGIVGCKDLENILRMKPNMLLSWKSSL